MGPAVDPLFIVIAVALIAALLIHAAATKLADRVLFEQHLAAYGVSPALQLAASWLLPIAEAAAVVAMLTPWRGAGAAVALGLLLLYAAVMAWHLARGHRPDCGCGGEPIRLSWWLVARNLFLASIAAIASLPATDRPLGVADFGVAAAALMLAACLYAALHQVLRQRRDSTPTLWRT